MVLNKIFKKFKFSPWDDDDNVFKNKKSFNIFNDFQSPNFNFQANKYILFLIIGVLTLSWLASGLYMVNEGEAGIVMRFGKYVRTSDPGLRYRIPSPIEQVIIEKVLKSRRLEIGYRSSEKSYGKIRNHLSYMPDESIMLTGDENIVDLNCDILWHIRDLEKYVFNVAAPEASVKAVSESVIREVIGETTISSVLSNQKQKIAEAIEERIQRTLDQYDSGIIVEQVQLLKAEPPLEVIDSYRDVQTSRADKEREINQAQAYKNDILPKARGDAEIMLQHAEGYKKQVVSIAEGKAQRFISIQKQYSNSKDVMKKRIYLDTIEKILSSGNKIITNQNIFTHYDIDKLKNNNK